MPTHSRNLTEVARAYEKDPATVYRWWKKGVRGVRLQTFMQGGHRHCTDEALEQFFAAITAASSTPGDDTGPPEPVLAGVDASAELARRGF